jgi:hypothetical protein
MRKTVSILLAVVLLLSLTLSAFAEPTLQKNKVANMLDLTNAIRMANDMPELELDSDLMQAAQLRALENAKFYSKDHMRPNGQKFFSVSTKVWCENISYGRKNETEAVNGWENSAPHLKNILDERCTIAGFGCAEGEDGVLYWVQLFGTGTSNYKWAMKDFDVKSFTYDPFNDPATPLDKSAPPETDTQSGGELTVAALKGLLSKAIAATPTGTVTVKVRNAASISPEAIKAFTSAAGDRTAQIYADSLSADGKSVAGRIVLEPAKMTDIKADILLGISTDAKAVAATKAAMEKLYSNKMAYICLSQASFPIATTIMVKVNLTDMDTDNLTFYSYNKTKKSISAIKNPHYKIDKNGYLSFSTTAAGDIVISDGELVRK